MSQRYDDDHPEVIRAKAESEERILKARAELHPSTQAIYAFWDSIGNLVGKIGCLLIIAIIVIAIIAPKLFGG